ncbi:MAG: hypothetical protein V4691_03040, partial [Pseudomonadota bacterium]
GWSSIIIGSTAGTGAMAVNAITWDDPLTLRSSTGVITIAGIQSMGANDLTVQTSGDPVISAALTGSGVLTIQPTAVNTTIGLAGGAGTLNLSAAELTQITDGWSSIIVGSTAGTGAMAVNAKTWSDPLTLRSNTGVITLAGAQAMGANDLNIQT